jgi:hypothetical protein
MNKKYEIKIKLESDAQTTLCDLIRDLKQMLNTGQDLEDLTSVEIAFAKMNKQELMNHVTSHILPQKSNIKNRNIEFFIKKKEDIFKGLPKDKLDYFSNYISSELSKDDREVIFTYFDIFIVLSERYKKNQ